MSIRSISALRVSTFRVILAVVFGFASSCAWSADLTFTNNTTRLLYFRVFDGKCGPASTLLATFSLNPSASFPVASKSPDTCYAAALAPDPNMAPLYCGAVQPPGVVIANSTPLCGLKASADSIATKPKSQPKGPVPRQQQAAPTSGMRASQTAAASDGPIYLMDRVRLELIAAAWTDPLTPPQTEAHCSNEAWGDWPWGGQWRFCVGWEIDCKWMNNELHVVATTGLPTTLDQLRKVVDGCLQTAATAGALAGLVAALGSGGTGAFAAAEETFRTLFLGCITENLVADWLNVSVDTRSQWSPWGACIRP